MLELKELLEKQLELLQIIERSNIEALLNFKNENSLDLEQIINTQHKAFQKEDEAYNIWNPDGDTFKYSMVKKDTALTFAIKNNIIDIVEQLLNWGAKINISEPQLTYLTILDNDILSNNNSENPAIQKEGIYWVESMPWKMPLQLAFQLGKHEIISKLLSKIDNIETINTIRDFEGNDIFYYIYGEGSLASEEKAVESFALLEEAGCNFDGSEIIINNKPLLQSACEFRKMHLANMLVENGTNLNIMIGQKTLFEFACDGPFPILIHHCIKHKSLHISVPENNNNNTLPNLDNTIMRNTIAVAKMIYQHVMEKKSFKYVSISYTNSDYNVESILSQSNQISPMILFGMKFDGKPLYELLLTNIHGIDSNLCSTFNKHSNEFVMTRHGKETLSEMVKFLAHYPNKTDIINFTKKFMILISKRSYLKEAIIQKEFGFAKIITELSVGKNFIELISSTQIIEALLSVASEDNLKFLIECGMPYLTEHNKFEIDNRISASRFRDVIELYNHPNSERAASWINYLRTLENAEHKAFIAESVLEILIRKNELKLEFVDPLIKLGADFNAPLKSGVNTQNPFSLAETILSDIQSCPNGVNILMKVLNNQEINFINETSPVSYGIQPSATNPNNLIKILKDHLMSKDNYGDFIENGEYENYAANFFLTQIHGISIFSRILTSSSIQEVKKIKFLAYVCDQNMKITAAELSKTIQGQPVFFHFIKDKNIEYSTKVMFLNYLKFQQHVNFNDIGDEFGNNILHHMAMKVGRDNLEEVTKLIDVLIEYGCTSSLENTFGSNAVSMRDNYNNGDLIRVTLKSHGTQTDGDGGNIGFMHDASTGENTEALGCNVEGNVI